MQNAVNIFPARGCNGAFDSSNPYANAINGFIAGTNGVKVGTFVWEDTDPNNAGQVVNSGSGLPMGLVIREQVNPILALGVPASELVPTGFPLTVAVTGDFHVKVAEAVTKGQRVFASLTDGTVKGASAGATVTGYVETNWVFTVGAEANDIATISNHGQYPAVSGSAPASYTAGKGIEISGNEISVKLTAGSGIAIEDGTDNDKVIKTNP